MKKSVGILLLCLIFNGCASSPDDYMSMTPRSLCIAWYERLGGNIHAEPMGIAIDRRGIDCNPYMDAMKEAKRSRDAFYDGLKENLKTTPTKQIRCTTVGNITTCHEI
jgi:hypothetical protein